MLIYIYICVCILDKVTWRCVRSTISISWLCELCQHHSGCVRMNVLCVVITLSLLIAPFSVYNSTDIVLSNEYRTVISATCILQCIFIVSISDIFLSYLRTMSKTLSRGISVCYNSLKTYRYESINTNTC